MTTLYLVKRTDAEPDYDKALSLVSHNDDALYFMEEMVAVLRDGILEPDDGTRKRGDDFVFEYHHGQGDGGSMNICNIHWIEDDFPDAFNALAIEWEKF